MHTFENRGVRFHFNGDFSGDVLVSIGDDRQDVTVAIPAAPVLSFVREIVGRLLEEAAEERDGDRPAGGRPVRAVRHDGRVAFEVVGVTAGWTWTEDRTGRIIRWGNVATGHEPGERLRKILEAAHFVWTVAGEPEPPWEWSIPEEEE